MSVKATPRAYAMEANKKDYAIFRSPLPVI